MSKNKKFYFRQERILGGRIVRMSGATALLGLWRKFKGIFKEKVITLSISVVAVLIMFFSFFFKAERDTSII